MLEPAGVQITRYDRELESLLAELAQKQAWHKTILDKKRDLDIELQAARTQLAELKGRSPLLFRSSHESRIHEAEESKNHLERELVAATLNAVLARNKVVEIHDKLDDAVREMKDLRSRMLDCKTNYCMLPESMIGMSRLWECLNGRIRLFKAEGAISSVYRPLALIGNSGVGKTRALLPIRGMLFSAGVLPSDSFCKFGVRDPVDIDNAIKLIDGESRGVLHVDASGYTAADESDSDQCRRNSDALERANRVVHRLVEKFPRLLVVVECRPSTADEVLGAFDDDGRPFVRPKDRIICDDLKSDDLISLLLASAVAMGPDRSASLSMANDAAKKELARGLELAKSVQGDRFTHGKIIDQLGIDLVTSAIELETGKTPRGEFVITREVVRSALESGGWVPSMKAEEDRKRVRAGVMAELHSLIGLGSVKAEFAKIERTLEFERKVAGNDGPDDRTSRGSKPSFAFLGPAGTGKTTVARLMARLLYGIGVCDTDKLISVNSNDLVAPYIGASGKHARDVIEKARGGVLFIDEAYNLRVSEDSAGRGDFVDAVIQELLTAMTSDDCNVAFVFAGYEDSMESFFNANEGIRSRIANYVRFDPYSSDELARISVSKLEKEGFHVTESALDPLRSLMAHIATLGEEYANARGAEKVAREIKDAKALQWARNQKGVNVHEIDPEVIHEVMHEHNIDAGTVCDVMHGCGIDSDTAHGPLRDQEDTTPSPCPLPTQIGDYRPLRGWLVALEEAGSPQPGLNARKGPVVINETLEALGYITPKPSRRFTEKALAELDVKEEERSGNAGPYIALLYSREAFDTALRIWRESGEETMPRS